MGLSPKDASRRSRLNAGLLPPREFIAAAMYLAVMPSAKRNRKFIADLASERR
jgi:hypothetical protein